MQKITQITVTQNASVFVAWKLRGFQELGSIWKRFFPFSLLGTNVGGFFEAVLVFLCS